MNNAVLAVLAAVLFAGESTAQDLRAALADVEGMLNEGVEFCRKGDVEAAEGKFSDAYFAAFETGGLEMAIRQRISGRRAFKLERMFHALRRMALEKKDATLIETEARNLVAEIAHDVSELEPTSVSPRKWLFAAPAIFVVSVAGALICVYMFVFRKRKTTSKEV